MFTNYDGSRKLLTPNFFTNFRYLFFWVYSLGKIPRYFPNISNKKMNSNITQYLNIYLCKWLLLITNHFGQIKYLWWTINKKLSKWKLMGKTLMLIFSWLEEDSEILAMWSDEKNIGSFYRKQYEWCEQHNKKVKVSLVIKYHSMSNTFYKASNLIYSKCTIVITPIIYYF